MVIIIRKSERARFITSRFDGERRFLVDPKM